MRKDLLDLYAGAGGAGEGYTRAGFNVVAVDNEPQPNNPHEFHQADAIEFLEKHGKDFHIIHASPPCQKFSCSTAPFRKAGKQYPDLIQATRKALKKLGHPFIIENVPPAPIRRDIWLVGYMFGLKVIRKRHFELDGVWLMQPLPPQKIGKVKDGDFVCVFGKGSYTKSTGDKKPKFAKDTILATWQYAMGIDWMKKHHELANAIPPAYTQYIGENIYHQI